MDSINYTASYEHDAHTGFRAPGQHPTGSQPNHELKLPSQPLPVYPVDGTAGTTTSTTQVAPRAENQMSYQNPATRAAEPLPIDIANLSSAPAPVMCPKCQQVVTTKMEFDSGNTTFAWACGLCIFAGCCGLIPFCIDDTKDVTHSCPNCNARLATWHRSNRIEVLAHPTSTGGTQLPASKAQ